MIEIFFMVTVSGKVYGQLRGVSRNRISQSEILNTVASRRTAWTETSSNTAI